MIINANEYLWCLLCECDRCWLALHIRAMPMQIFQMNTKPKATKRCTNDVQLYSCHLNLNDSSKSVHLFHSINCMIKMPIAFRLNSNSYTLTKITLITFPKMHKHQQCDGTDFVCSKPLVYTLLIACINLTLLWII